MSDMKETPSIEEVLKIADTLKPSEKTARKLEVNEMDDDDLSDVSGGFWKKKGYSKGYWIECPSCGNSKKANIEKWKSDRQNCDIFHCWKCGQYWGVDSVGHILLNV